MSAAQHTGAGHEARRLFPIRNPGKSPLVAGGGAAATRARTGAGPDGAVSGSQS